MYLAPKSCICQDILVSISIFKIFYVESFKEKVLKRKDPNFEQTCQKVVEYPLRQVFNPVYLAQTFSNQTKRIRLAEAHLSRENVWSRQITEEQVYNLSVSDK